MRESYDFSNAIKNPFSGKEKGKFVVKINYDSTKEYKQKQKESSKDSYVAEPSKRLN